MGRRHQAFLIARVRPHGTPPDHPGNRRCIAAFHHQSCYESLPLEATHRLIALVSQPENASVVGDELRAIDGKYGSSQAQQPRIPSTPCPFTISLLGAAWTTDLDLEDDFYSSGITLSHGALDAYMGCWDGDNNDGISVIDVSEPEEPSYCFLRHSTPLTAKGYLQSYYPEALHQAFELFDFVVVNLVENLADVPVLSIQFLREAWPDVRFTDATPATKSEPMAALKPPAVPTLMDTALELAVKHSIDRGDTTELEGLVWLPDKAKQITTILRSLEIVVDGALPLLSAVVTYSLGTDATRVDLSGFQMSGAHVVKILPSLPDRVQSLDLSYNAIITADDILAVVAASPPTLRRLVVMACPSVDGTRLLELVRTQPSHFKMIEGIIHPALLTITKPEPYPHAFTFITPESLGRGGISCISVPFFTPPQILHALLDIIPYRVNQSIVSPREMTWTLHHSMLAFSALQGGARTLGQKFSERVVTSVPAHSPYFPSGQTEMWAFVLNVKIFGFGRSGYVFIHYKQVTSGDGAQDQARQPGSVGQVPFDLRFRKRGVGTDTRYTSQLYDLQGFLECMAKEGRPMPRDDVVQELREIFSAKDPLDEGSLLCPLMDAAGLQAIAGALR